jgi:UDP-N-acetyl-D-glucosamine dehydrogenase
MAQICDRLDVDVFEVIEAAATKPFGFMKFAPGPGIGGHCIPLDPHYLAWKMKTLNYRTRMIELAGELNSEMPRYVVAKVSDALNDIGRALRGSRILVLGVAYKRDIDDVRESPALDIIRLLEEKGAHVVFHDPHVDTVHEEGRARNGVPLSSAELEAAHCVLIATDHSAVEYERLVGIAAPVIDTRNAMRGLQSENVIGLSGQPRGGPLERSAGVREAPR